MQLHTALGVTHLILVLHSMAGVIDWPALLRFKPGMLDIPATVGISAGSANDQAIEPRSGHHTASRSQPFFARRSDPSTQYDSDMNSTDTNSSSSDVDTTRSPIWNKNNVTCSSLTQMSPADAWKAVDGDLVVQTLSDFFDGDKIICDDCWGQVTGACRSTLPECQSGLANLSRPNREGDSRFDTAAARFAWYVDWNDLTCGMAGSSECDGAPNCASCNGPGTWAVLKQMQVMHNNFQNVWWAIKDAGDYVDTQSELFTSVFAPVPDLKSEVIMETVLFGIAGGLLGFLPELKALAKIRPGTTQIASATIFGTMGGIVMTETFFGAPPAADADAILGGLVDHIADIYGGVADALFRNGTYQWTSGDGKQTTSQSLVQLMEDGKFMQASGSANATYDALVPNYKLILFQQLAFFTWSYLQTDKKPHVPYIAWDDGDCDKVKADNYTTLRGLNMVSDADCGISYDNRCYYLLNAHSTPVGPSRPPEPDRCLGKDPLPGGTNKAMKENAGSFASLSMEHFIIPSVEGWKSNSHLNGYPKASDDGKLVNNPLAAGAVNIPVCDFLNNFKNPGVGCPQLTTNAVNGACKTFDPSTGNNQPGDFAPGWCRLHVTQYFKNQMKDDLNPLSVYQLAVEIFDDSSRPIGAAAKQPADKTLAITDSVLPLPLLVAASGSDDTSPIEFWYGDQYWNSDSKENQCKVDKAKGGQRGMNCGFRCPYDNMANVTSVQIAHPFTLPPTPALPGATAYQNTWAISDEVPTATGSSAAATATTSYDKGNCSMHIIQYQKHEKKINDGPDYALEITLFDDKKHVLTSSGMVRAPTDQPVPIAGLDGIMNVTCHEVDADPVKVDWGSVHFQTNDTSHCSKFTDDEHGYENGNRDIDCSFIC